MAHDNVISYKLVEMLPPMAFFVKRKKMEVCTAVALSDTLFGKFTVRHTSTSFFSFPGNQLLDSFVYNFSRFRYE